MTRALVLVLVAACGGGSQSDAGVDGPDQRPDADNDLDYDGIKDDADNCPMSNNADQANEDGDRFGDVCDPCPIVSDDAPPDGDGDGVADACDPVPAMFGDRIAFFQGFKTGVPSGWEQTGTWTHTSGAVMTSSAVASLAILATDRTRDTVSASISIDAITDTSASAGVLDNKQVGGAPAVGCSLTGAPALAVYATADAANATTTAYEMTPGATYLMKLRRDMNAYTCSAANGTATAQVTKTVTLTNTPYLSGLATSGATVRVHWLMVVESL